MRVKKNYAALRWLACLLIRYLLYLSLLGADLHYKVVLTTLIAIIHPAY